MHFLPTPHPRLWTLSTREGRSCVTQPVYVPGDSGTGRALAPAGIGLHLSGDPRAHRARKETACALQVREGGQWPAGISQGCGQPAEGTGGGRR